VIYNFLFEIFRYLTSIDFNIWGYLYLIGAPVLVFSIKPKSPARRRVLWFSLSILLLYVTYILSTQTERYQDGKLYDKCMEETTEGRYTKCRKHLPMRSLKNSHKLALLFLHNTIYFAIWVTVWRLYYIKTIKNLGKTYRAKWFDYFLMIPFFGILLNIFTAIPTLIFYMLIDLFY
jgi:hypothetical protein